MAKVKDIDSFEGSKMFFPSDSYCDKEFTCKFLRKGPVGAGCFLFRELIDLDNTYTYHKKCQKCLRGDF